MVSIIIIYYNLLGPPSYMRSVVDRNVVKRRMTVYGYGWSMLTSWTDAQTIL